MRVLIVARTFLPESRGGSENHAFQLARYLLSQGNQVAVLHVRFAPGREYELSEGMWEGLRIFRLVRNYTSSMLNPFPFYDRQVEVAFEQVLASYEPDLAHIHLLADLSASIPGLASRHGIPCIMTLHDFWPMCFLGHLRTPDGLLCPGPDGGLRCAECLWKQWQGAAAPVSIRARVRELGMWQSLRRAPRFLADAAAARLPGTDQAGRSSALRTQMVSLTVRDNFLRQALLRCELLLSPSRFLMGRFVEWGIPASHLRYIPNSAPASLRRLRLAPSGVGATLSGRPTRGPVVFGFIGSLYPPKGVHVLVDAFRRLEAGRAELHIWGQAPSAGEQAYAEGVRQQARGVSGLVFEGGFPPDELERVLSQIDVLVLPSIWYENNPLVILEAQAAGIPCLVSDAGGMAELVQQDGNGLRFRIGDAQDLASKMGLMLDRDRLARYRAATVSPWTHEECGAEVERIYRQLVARSRDHLQQEGEQVARSGDLPQPVESPRGQCGEAGAGTGVCPSGP
jgi:glycosyltransferase involved in cell wall biosynthesis